MSLTYSADPLDFTLTYKLSLDFDLKNCLVPGFLVLCLTKQRGMTSKTADITCCRVNLVFLRVLWRKKLPSASWADGFPKGTSCTLS